VPAKNTDDGIRAVKGAQVIEPDSVRRYLNDKFGDDLRAVRSAMQKLAKAYKHSELAHDAYPLYEQFRPAIQRARGMGSQGRTGPGPDREAGQEEAE